MSKILASVFFYLCVVTKLCGSPSLRGKHRPPIHQVTLKVILQHLSKVAEHSDQNKMTAANLSVVFSPCLLSEADHETTSVAAAMVSDL